MRKKIIGFAVGLGILGFGTLLFFTFFEIVEDEYYIPSREARRNNYLALDKWLVSEGHNVRVENMAALDSFKAATEGVMMIKSELVEWDDETLSWLDAWVEGGGVLILCLDFYRDWDEGDALGSYLNSLGLETVDGENGDYLYHWDDGEPAYGTNLMFNEPENASLVLKDAYDCVRVVEFARGRGKITVTGKPPFMTNNWIKYEANARLSWYLFADHPGKSVFFVRGSRRAAEAAGGFFERGNFFIIIISGLVLIAVGFWAVIPMFGVVQGFDEKTGKPLVERFLAEGRFLRRFKALDSYRFVYIKEIKRKLAKKGKHNNSAAEKLPLKNDEMVIKAAAVYAGGSQGVKAVAKAVETKPQNEKEFYKSVIVLKTIVERL